MKHLGIKILRSSDGKRHRGRDNPAPKPWRKVPCRYRTHCLRSRGGATDHSAKSAVPKARANIRLLFFSNIADQSEHSSRDGSHWIIHKSKQTARNEVKPLKLKCRSLSFPKCLTSNLSDLPSLHPIYIRKQLNFVFACILLDEEVAGKFNFEQ